MFQFKLVEDMRRVKPESKTVYLEIDSWDDFGFKTLFKLAICILGLESLFFNPNLTSVN